jgi:uncharacterized membrane protein YkgB
MNAYSSISPLSFFLVAPFLKYFKMQSQHGHELIGRLIIFDIMMIRIKTHITVSFILMKIKRKFKEKRFYSFDL